MENKSMFISHGFAIHVTWEGSRGRDQFGHIWVKANGYAQDENQIHNFKIEENAKR